MAPEADGSWDAETISGTDKPVYRKYKGPNRKNHDFGWPEWNVFPIWKETCPKALEAAEVFSVGRSMWMLLTQTAEDEFENGGVVKCSVGKRHQRDPRRLEVCRRKMSGP